MDIYFLGLPKYLFFFYPHIITLNRSGKTSIIKTIFERMGCYKTMMLDPTSKIEKTTKTLSFLQVNAYDFPGKYNLSGAPPEELPNLEECKTIVFAIDVQVINNT